jgi:signal transduction histidine kinase
MNAIEAMMAQPAGTRRLHLAVARAPGGGALSVAVRDSGSGIPPQEIGKVFDAFYTTKPTGMGMGLAVSRSIVEAHGGAIRVEPNADRGVTFSFTLPQNTEVS